MYLGGAQAADPNNGNLAGLLRRITAGEKEQRFQACTELRRAILDLSDAKILSCSPLAILRQLDEQFYLRLNSEVKKEIAKCISALGFRMGVRCAEVSLGPQSNYKADERIHMVSQQSGVGRIPGRMCFAGWEVRKSSCSVADCDIRRLFFDVVVLLRLLLPECEKQFLVTDFLHRASVLLGNPGDDGADVTLNHGTAMSSSYLSFTGDLATFRNPPSFSSRLVTVNGRVQMTKCCPKYTGVVLRYIVKCKKVVEKILMLIAPWRRYISWLFENYDNCTNNDIRALYMQALTMSYNYDRSAGHFEKVTPDVVDIVIGWYLDTSLEKEYTASYENALMKLQYFWLNDMQFTLMLLSQFLEDAEAYVEDLMGNLANRRFDQLKPEYVIKTASLIKAFKTILSAIAECIAVTPENFAYVAFVNDAVSKINYCIRHCLKIRIPMASRVLNASISALQTLFDLCRLSPDMITPALIDIGCIVGKDPSDIDTENLCSLVSLLKKVSLKTSPDIMVGYVRCLIGISGVYYNLRFHNNQRVCSYFSIEHDSLFDGLQVSAEVLDAYKGLLVPRGVKYLQEAYRYITGEMFCCLRVMRCHSSDQDDVTSHFGVDDALWPDEKLKYSLSFAETVMSYLLVTLTEIATAKNSVIGVSCT
ncbi:unnamed protein product [Soboliphyme baturini]|uniref:Non-specific serine/threonine protein kinase n=1 Tax=Soboliphyme baturini TaxID=241478 RepID=A0A183IQG4_9BILA|nr:unnamed protein product [Soboliphyme baturini]